MAKEKLTIKNAALVKGEQVVVRGQLGFCKYLTKLLEGKELEASVARREYANEKPHYEGTLVNPKVIAKTKGQPTDAEKVIAGKVYVSTAKDGTETPSLGIEKNVSKEGKGQILFGVKRADGIHKVDVQGKALAAGQNVEVTYVTREYEYKGKKGLSLFLDTIVFTDGEPEFYKAPQRDGWVSDDAETPATDESPAEEAPAEEAPAEVWD